MQVWANRENRAGKYSRIEEILTKNKPDIVPVQGDSKMEYINNNLREFYEINQN